MRSWPLSGLRLDIPPLRERPGDVDLLLTEYIRHFSSLYSRYYVLSEGARRVLLEYEWAGNRNQMESFCARLVLTATNRTIDEAFVRNLLEELYPVIYKENERARIVVYQNEEAMRIERMLDKYDGDRAHTANALGISKTTLWRHMKKYGIGSYRGINLHDE